MYGWMAGTMLYYLATERKTWLFVIPGCSNCFCACWCPRKFTAPQSSVKRALNISKVVK